MKSGRVRGCVAVLGVVVVLAVFLVTVMWIWWQRDPLVVKPASPPDAVVIQNTTVIDVVSGQSRPAVDVRVEGATIKSISPTGGDTGAAAVINGAGKYVVPGLIDMHAHLHFAINPAWDLGVPRVDRNLEQFLYAGVTRVLDPGAPVPDAFVLRDEVASAQRLGPTIHTAGPMLTAVGGHPMPAFTELLGSLAPTMAAPMTREVADAAAAKAAVDGLASDNPDFIKIVVDALPPDAPTFDESLARAVSESARKHGIRTVAHIGSTADAQTAGRAGVAAWVHGVYKEPIPDDAIAELVSFGIPMIATMTVFKAHAELGTPEHKATALERQIADSELLSSFENRPPDFARSPKMQQSFDLFREHRTTMMQNTKRLHDAGVRILAGSDQQGGLVPGASLHRELVLMQRAGLAPIEVLRAATVYAARFLAETEDPPYGVIGQGKRADLLIVNADPTQDVQALADIDRVMLGGVVLQRHPLTQ